jgi:hypothetical protein
MVATALRRDWWILALNVVAMVAYFWASSPGILEPETRSFTDNGYALLSVLRSQCVLPLLAGVMLLNLAWLYVRIRQQRQIESTVTSISFVLCGGWIAAYAINRLFG